MISLKQINKIMLKIFSVMEKLNEFSNQMAKSGISPDYGRELRKSTKKATRRRTRKATRRRIRRRIAQRENDKQNSFF